MNPIIVRPIESEKEYLQTLNDVSYLMESDNEEELLEALFSVVEDYEEIHYPIPKPNVYNAVRYYIESRGLIDKLLEIVLLLGIYFIIGIILLIFLMRR